MGNGYRNPSATRPARGLKRDRDNEDKIERWKEQELDIDLGEQELRKRFLAEQQINVGPEAKGNRSNIALSKSSFSAADPNVVSRFKESTRAINPNSFSAPSQGSLRDRWSAPDASGRSTFSSGSIVGNVFGEGGRIIRPGTDMTFADARAGARIPLGGDDTKLIEDTFDPSTMSAEVDENLMARYADLQSFSAGDPALVKPGAQSAVALSGLGPRTSNVPGQTTPKTTLSSDLMAQTPGENKPFWEVPVWQRAYGKGIYG